MVYREAEEIRAVKTKAREAISLAMEAKWQEAAAMNREIIDAIPEDLDAWNRLGKALLELGDPKGATAAFEHTLTINPENAIARKNLERLSAGQTATTGGSQMNHKVFTGDSGKSAHVMLMGVAAGKAKPDLAPGTAIELRVSGGNLAAFTGDGRYVGIVPPKLARRLVGMIEAGNKYDGAVASAAGDGVRVVLRESYQHPSMRAMVSFPASMVTPPPSPQPQARPVAQVEQEEPVAASVDADLVDDDEDSLEAASVSAGSMLDDDLPDDDEFDELTEEAV